MMGHQLDEIIIQPYLLPIKNIKNQLLTNLEKKKKKKGPERKKENWFQVYSVVFIVPYSLEKLLAYSRNTARRFCILSEGYTFLSPRSTMISIHLETLSRHKPPRELFSTPQRQFSRIRISSEGANHYH